MLHAFTDESYTQEWFFQAAYILDESLLGEIQNSVDSTLEFAARFGISPNTQIHGYSIMNGINGWEPLKGKFNSKLSIYRHLMGALLEINGSLLLQGLQSLDGAKKTDLNKIRYQNSHQLLTKQIENFAKNEQKNVRIFAEQLTDSKELIKEFKSLTPNQIIHDLEFVKAVEYPGIQIVDACLYLVQRSIVIGTSKGVDGREIEIFNEVRSLFHPDFEPKLLRIESTEGSH